MNRQIAQSNRSRSLWLERLERRWMLHAHADLLPIDHDDYRRDSGGQQSRAFEVGDPLQLQPNDQVQSNHQLHLHKQSRIGDHRVPHTSEQVGMEARPSSPKSIATILAPPPLTVIVILQPATDVSSPSISQPVVQDNVFQRSAPAVSTPIVNAPLISNVTNGESNESLEVRLANIDNALQMISADDTDTESSDTSKLRAEAEDAANLIQVESLVSIQPRESELGPTDESSNLGDLRLRIGTALDSPRTLELERVDHWLNEFSKVKDQLSDLETTLEGLAKQQRSYRALEHDKLSRSLQQDQAKFSWQGNVVPEVNAKADEMIWLVPIAAGAESHSVVADEPWSESETAQWTLGVGWHRSFEFSDPTDSDGAVSESPLSVRAAATPSDVVLDAARPANNGSTHISVNRSVSYAVVAVSVASWQVLQRRRRRDGPQSKDHPHFRR